jgi:2,3-bisphosphoglycerate-independent phosphoglycerate mutase
VIEALGADVEMQAGDIAARGNFATRTSDGVITDRRAGRIDNNTGIRLSNLLNSINIPNVEFWVRAGESHRFVLRIRGANLSEDVSSNDPQHDHLHLLPILPISESGKRTAEVVNEFIVAAEKLLENEHPANTILLRGFSQSPTLPPLKELYGLQSAAVAPFPMYRGIAKLMGMDPLPCGKTLGSQLECLRSHYTKYDLFYVHFKAPDMEGEDGDFVGKTEALSDFDTIIPEILALCPDVLVITGDHSTPALLQGHSWHGVPLLLNSRYCRPSGMAGFSEKACLKGSLGHFRATELMPLILAHAQRLQKFGA